MVLIGFSDTLSLAQSIGIVGTMVLTPFFIVIITVVATVMITIITFFYFCTQLETP